MIDYEAKYAALREWAKKAWHPLYCDANRCSKCGSIRSRYCDCCFPWVGRPCTCGLDALLEDRT